MALMRSPEARTLRFDYRTSRWGRHRTLYNHDPSPPSRVACSQAGDMVLAVDDKNAMIVWPIEARGERVDN